MRVRICILAIAAALLLSACRSTTGWETAHYEPPAGRTDERLRWGTITDGFATTFISSLAAEAAHATSPD